MPSISLKASFALSFAAAILAACAILSSVIGSRSSAEVKGEIGRNLAEITFQIADKLDRGMWARTGEVGVLSTLVGLGQGDQPQAIQASLDRLKKDIPIFSWIGVTDTQGRVLAATDGILAGADISSRPVYANGIKGTFVGDVHDAKLLAKSLPNPSGEPIKFVDISTQIHRAGHLWGVVAAHLSWDWAREIEESVLKPVGDRHAIQVFVVARDNVILLGPKDQIGDMLDLDLIQQARQGRDGWAVQHWPDGRDYLTGVAHGRGHKNYPGLGWTVLARQPLEHAFAPVETLKDDITRTGAIIAILSALFGWLVASRVTAPLHRISRTADRLRLGEKVEIPEHHGISDIEILSRSLRALIHSLTQSEAARDQAESLATHDTLTGLPNRLALASHLGQVQAQARRGDLSIAVLCLDLDGFKAVNDGAGHHVGDLLLQEVAERLRHSARTGDFICRLGGDEFLMIITAAQDKIIEDAERVGNRTILALSGAMELDGFAARIGCSVGVACWPLHDPDLHQVVQLADQALYASKRAGKGRVSFHPPQPQPIPTD